MIAFMRRRFWPLLLACAALAAAILVWMPAEKTLGQVIKIVYLHGALSRAGMLGLIGAGVAGIVYLMRPRPALARWIDGLLLSGWGFWLAHFVISMPATHYAWGPWIAWGEPRVTMTLQVLAAGLVVIAINRMLAEPRFSAAAAALLAGAVVILASRIGALRHPLDPIGASPSTALRLAYLGLLLPIISSMILIAWRLTQARGSRTQLRSDVRAEA